MEFSDLGKMCNFCNRQDYLPIKCDNCHKFFCSEHSSMDSHKCQDIKKKKKGKNKN
jgi:predicted nucleic acid binding AN1-type Zn finger protein